MKFENEQQAPRSRLEQVKQSMRVPPDPGIRGKNKVSVLAKNLAEEFGIPVQEKDEVAETGDKIILVPEKQLVTIIMPSDLCGRFSLTIFGIILFFPSIEFVYGFS